ncbi:metal-sensing transcriptional repressor [Butyricicoccus porcorum]|uniref:Copper-sensing transcriptional repressor CsoR n=1 Tax=Butyricicoccus porcorum TaxID=1945634 RepID=A0A252F2Q7_9FIRM|nr:metal-sensing transcriptional repressor [Butyricicoccus porcorum]MCI6927043.1 metal-sensing transcriptional repressor [Butyricicoccus porcorum]MDD6985967.1 metal-sensing transcriptional repressor [Butyricicoccus porcorum]MDY4483810.1 metal-sensing transcriptional repressor [Butyricicoccus porcorum]OUM19890.1 transcriptional regulator [Butyricicoccus porcorum]
MRADKENVSRLLRTARGQIDGILRMIDEDAYCIDISNQVMAARSVLGRANREIISAHLEGCVLDAMENGTGEEKMKEIMALIDKLSR